MTQIKLTRHDLMISLREQLFFLDSSISNYSNKRIVKKCENKVIGTVLQTEISSEVEAKRIATIIRVLLHDTSYSFSLLKQLDIKESILYIDTAAPNDGRMHSMTNLHRVSSQNSSQYLGLVARVNTGESLLATPLYIQHLTEWYGGYDKCDFDSWWNKNVLDISGSTFTRKDLVLYVANKDGGAHIDASLSDEYMTLKATNLSLNIEGVHTEFESNIIYASLAQIGWEMLNSIEYD